MLKSPIYSKRYLCSYEYWFGRLLVLSGTLLRCMSTEYLLGKHSVQLIIHYQLLYHTILANIFLNIAFLQYYFQEAKKQVTNSLIKNRYSYTITQLSKYMISIEHGANHRDWISHLMWADKSWNTQFTNSIQKQRSLFVFRDDLYLASGWYWIPMSFGSLCVTPGDLP